MAKPRIGITPGDPLNIHSPHQRRTAVPRLDPQSQETGQRKEGVYVQMRVTPVRGELRRLPARDPRAAVLVARVGGVPGEREPSAGRRRLVSVRHLLRRDELPDELVVLELLEPGFGFRDVGFTVFPGDNPLPLRVDVNDVATGPYLFSLERWTAAVYIPPVYVP